jgi:hypothetical protein
MRLLERPWLIIASDIELPRREWIAGAVAELPCTVRYVVCFQQRKHISARH